ncbi:MAG: hypothetical protein U1E67_08055 [Hyphomicrobiales bacterium]
MDAEQQLMNKIVALLSGAFIFRRNIRPDDLARELAKSVDLPVEVLVKKVAMVAKGLGVGIAPK